MSRIWGAIAASFFLVFLPYARADTIVAPAPWVPVGNTESLSVTPAGTDRVQLGWVGVSQTAPSTAKVCNTGTIAAYVLMGDSGVTVTTGTGTLITAGICAPIAVQGQRYLAGVTGSSTTTLAIQVGSGTVLAGTAGGGGGGTGCLVSGGAGIVLNDGANGCATDTASQLTAGALSLGSSGVPGSTIFGNATTGTITLQPVTGALGTVTLSLPAATDQLVGRATTDTLTNKTLSSPTITGSLTATGLVTYADIVNGTGAALLRSNTGAAPSEAPTGAGILTWIGTPSSANLAAALTNETGTGLAVFNTNPTISGATLTGVPILPGLSVGTQVSCLGLDSGNSMVLNLCGGGGGGAPTGPAGGDLNGTYPNPGVSGINGAAPGPYYSAPSATINRIVSGTTNTVTTLIGPVTQQLWLSASTGAKAQTIPACSAGIDGFAITVKDGQGTAGTYPITVAPASSTIDGVASVPITTNTGSLTFRCDGTGTNWTIIGYLSGTTVRTGTATSLTVDTNDNGNVIQWNSGSAVAATVGQPSTPGFPVGAYSTLIQNRGAGTITLTPTSSTITVDGSGAAASADIPKNTSLFLFSGLDGNYYGARLADTGAVTGIVKGSGAGAITAAAAGTDYAAATTGSANTPLFNNGSGGFTNGTRSGNTTEVVTATGSLTSGGCAQWDASGNLTAVAPCGTGGGGSISITAGGNTETGVTTIAAGTGFLVPGGSSGTAAFTATNVLNTQSGTGAYAIASTDANKTIYRTNASGGADTLVVASTSGFTSGYATSYATGSFAGNTITPTTSTINGLSALKLGANQGIEVWSDSTNYHAILGVPQPATQTGTTFLKDDMTWGSPAGSGTVTQNGNLTTHAPILGGTNGTSDIKSTAAMTNGQLLVGATGADAAPQTMSQDCSLGSTAVITCTKTNNVSFGTLATTAPGTGVATAAAANLSANGGLTTTIFSGSKALATGAISSATCATVVTDTATGTLTTDVVLASFNGDPTAVTGYVPLTTGMLTIIVYPTANTVNFKVCNNSSSSITPGAITLNWRVVR